MMREHRKGLGKVLLAGGKAHAKLRGENNLGRSKEHEKASKKSTMVPILERMNQSPDTILWKLFSFQLRLLILPFPHITALLLLN